MEVGCSVNVYTPAVAEHWANENQIENFLDVVCGTDTPPD